MSDGLELTNILLGLGNIGAGIGFRVAENKKKDELDEKIKKLKDTVTTTSNLYDLYYMVATNLDRVSKALDSLPTDLVDKLQKKITKDLEGSDAEKAIRIIAKYMGCVGGTIGIITGLVQLIMYLRTKRAQGGGEEPSEPTTDPFEDVPGETPPPPPPEGETSFTESPKLTKFVKGLKVAGIVFGLAGLAATLGLRAWTLEKLNKAISDVEEKQKQVEKFQESLTKVLDDVLKAAGLKEKSYDDLIKIVNTWKKLSQNYDSYEKALYYAITGYFRKLSIDKIKAAVEKESDKDMPFPEDAYPLAKTLADDIKYQMKKKNKSDKEIVSFFATENPKIGLRLVFDECFIGRLRWFI